MLTEAALEASCARRCRRDLVFGIFVHFLSLIICLPDGTPGHVTASWRRSRRGVDTLMNNMLKHEFTRTFRMTAGNVRDLFSSVSDSLHHDVRKAGNSSGGIICPQARLLMTLCFLAGGAVQDMMVIFGVSKEAVYDCIWLVLEALVAAHPIVFSTRPGDLASTARGFMARQRVPVLKGIVRAVDGILVAIRSPSILEHWKPMSFWCRKQYNALNVQCVCNAGRKILFIAVDCPGSVHD